MTNTASDAMVYEPAHVGEPSPVVVEHAQHIREELGNDVAAANTLSSYQKNCPRLRGQL